jgi:hypothetical protein
VEAQALWQVEKNTGNEAADKWDRESPGAYKLRDELLRTFRFAFRKHPHLPATIKSKQNGHARMLQDLNDLSILGKENKKLLQAIRFDLALLDEAARLAEELAPLLAEKTTGRLRHSEAKKIRDCAYTHLKEAVDEIRQFGQFLFNEDKYRFAGYGSAHLRQLNRKKKQSTRLKAEKPEPDTVETEDTPEEDDWESWQHKPGQLDLEVD